MKKYLTPVVFLAAFVLVYVPNLFFEDSIRGVEKPGLAAILALTSYIQTISTGWRRGLACLSGGILGFFLPIVAAIAGAAGTKYFWFSISSGLVPISLLAAFWLLAIRRGTPPTGKSTSGLISSTVLVLPIPACLFSLIVNSGPAGLEGFLTGLYESLLLIATGGIGIAVASLMTWIEKKRDAISLAGNENNAPKPDQK